MGLAPHVARRLSHVGVILVFAAIAVLQGGPRATREARAVEADARGPAPTDTRWSLVEAALGRPGIADGGALRFDFPRSDVVVCVGTDTLSPRLALTTTFSFVRDGTGDVTAVGEVVLRSEEAPAALAEARRQGITVLAADDALTGEMPRVVHAAVSVRGGATTVAAQIHAMLATTATPLARDDRPPPPPADWSALDTILGTRDEAVGTTATYAFRRRRDGGASRAMFQQLGGGRVAAAGAVHVLARERDAVVRTLATHGLQVTAVHAHLPDDALDRVWVHWFATGDGPTLARGVAAALARTAP